MSAGPIASATSVEGDILPTNNPNDVAANDSAVSTLMKVTNRLIENLSPAAGYKIDPNTSDGNALNGASDTSFAAKYGPTLYKPLNLSRFDMFLSRGNVFNVLTIDDMAVLIAATCSKPFLLIMPPFV